MARMYFTNSEERDEYDDLWAEAWSAGTEAVAAAEAAWALLLDAEQAGRTWASRVMEAATIGGLTAMGKKWEKAHQPKVVVAHNGAVIGRTNQVYSLPVRRSESGETAHAMTLFEEMTWAELGSLVEETERRIHAAATTRTAAIKLLGLRAAHPTAATVGEALQHEGLSLEEFLGGGQVAS